MIGPIRLLLGAAAGVATLASIQAQEPAQASEFCQLAGALGHMLGYVERQCPTHRLTRVGQDLLIETTGRIVKRTLDTGESFEECLAIGKHTMVLNLGTRYPHLLQITDQSALTRATCKAIAASLRDLGGTGDKALVARQR